MGQEQQKILRGPERTEVSLRKRCQAAMRPLRMRRAMGSQADNAIPKCCNT